jgi:hypothetical protein
MFGALFVNIVVAAIGVITAAVAVILSIVAIRRARRDSGPGRARLSRLETITIALVGAGGIVTVPLAMVGLVTSAVSVATSPSVLVRDLPTGGVFPEVLRDAPSVLEATYSTAAVEVAGLPGSIRALLWTESALPTLAALTIGTAVAWLAIALLRGRPFARALPVVLGIVAIVVVAAGLGAQVVGPIARAEVVLFLGPPEVITGEGGFAAFSSVLDFAPLGWGLGIALVSAAFTIGSRLQKDAEGLV